MRKFLTASDQIIPAHYTRVLVETAVSLGASRKDLLAGTGVLRAELDSPDARLSYNQFDSIVDNALRLTREPALGIHVGQNLGSAQIGILGLAVASATTLASALDLWMRSAPLIMPAWQILARMEGTRAFLGVRETFPRGHHLPFATEVVLASVDLQTRTLLRRPVPVRAIQFGYPRPAHADRYAKLANVPMIFDAPFTEVEFDAEVLTAPIPFADPAVAKLTEAFCTTQLLKDAPAQGLIARMRELLAAVEGGPPTVAQLARTLQTSTRTLERSLRQMGTSYRALLEESRNERARELARQPAHSVEAVAELLGFDNVRSFRRAFRRWAGTSFEEFRERAANSGGPR